MRMMNKPLEILTWIFLIGLGFVLGWGVKPTTEKVIEYTPTTAKRNVIRLNWNDLDKQVVDSIKSFRYDTSYFNDFPTDTAYMIYSLPPNTSIVTDGRFFKVIIDGYKSLWELETRKEARNYAWELYRGIQTTRNKKWIVVEENKGDK